MEQSSLNRMNTLFERMVSNMASPSERMELNHLYDQFFFDGRDCEHIRHTREYLKVVNGYR